MRPTLWPSRPSVSRAWALVHQGQLERNRIRHGIAARSTTVRDYERTHIVETLRARILSVVADRLGVDPDEDYRAPLLTGLFIELLVSAKRRWIESGSNLLTEINRAWRALDELAVLDPA